MKKLKIIHSLIQYNNILYKYFVTSENEILFFLILFVLIAVVLVFKHFQVILSDILRR
jgi:hypothetical protein